MDNQRLILFIVFSFSLLLLWEAWQDKHAPPPPAVTAANAPSVSAGTPPIPSQGLNAPAAAPAQTGFAKGARAVVETDVLRATIDADGGDLRQLQLLTYRETETRNEIFTLFEEDPAQPYLAQSGLLGKDLPTHRSVFQLNPGTYRLTRGASQVEVPLVWNDPATGVRVEKTYIFKRNSYEIALRTRVINNGTEPVDLTPYYQFTRHSGAPRGASFFLHTFTGPAFYTDAKKFQKVTFKAIQEGKAEFEKTAENGWVSLVQHHFVAAWLPGMKAKTEKTKQMAAA